MRTALEQELGLAAYFVSNDVPLEKGAKNEVLESDGEKLSSTDEDEEAGVEGEGVLTHLCVLSFHPPEPSFKHQHSQNVQILPFFPSLSFWCGKMGIPVGSSKI